MTEAQPFAQASPAASSATTLPSLDTLVRTIVNALDDVKARDIAVFDTAVLSPLFERLIIATAGSARQTRALAAAVRDAVKDAGAPPPRHEGEDNGEWVIVDCGACVVHVMQGNIRNYYRLEELWGEKPIQVETASQKALENRQSRF